MSEQAGREPVAITLGSPTDHEMRCAAGVAERLGWKQVKSAVDLSAFSRFGETCVKLEMLANGLGDLAFFQGIDAIRGIRPSIVTGFAGDSLMGGGHVGPGWEKEDRDTQFAKKFAAVTRHGFPPAMIDRLLRPEFRHCTDGVVTDLRRSYHACEGLPFQQSWLFEIRHRIRYHTAGSVLNRIAYGAWPIIPYADKGFVTAVLGMPPATLLNRRVQVDLICRRFPHLAKLPLDRNSGNTSPLLKPPWHPLLARMGRLLKRAGNPARNGADGRLEQRYYYRVFDINNPGWVELRRKAEPFRERAATIFEPDILRELLPPPHEQIRLQDGIIDAAGRKVLIGFMLWAGGNL
jgi:asparagine synthase (glutamine-hydrolysing)